MKINGCIPECVTCNIRIYIGFDLTIIKNINMYVRIRAVLSDIYVKQAR